MDNPVSCQKNVERLQVYVVEVKKCLVTLRCAIFTTRTQCQCQCQSNVYTAPKVEGGIWGTGVWMTRRDKQKRNGEI